MIPKFKICASCETPKPTSEFWLKRDRKDGRDRERIVCGKARNKRKHTARTANKVYKRSRNGEVPHGTNSRYVHYRCRCEECRAARSYFMSGLYTEDPARFQAYTQVYARTERGRQSRRSKALTRRGRHTNAAGTASVDQITARWDYYGGRCWVCGIAAGALDHVIPLSRNGSNWPANLRPICKSCNSKKSNRSPTHFLSIRERRILQTRPSLVVQAAGLFLSGLLPPLRSLR